MVKRSKQQSSDYFRLVNKITNELWKEAKEKGVTGTLYRRDYVKEAHSLVKLFHSILVKYTDLPVISYNDFKGTLLVTHSGSDMWWLNNCVGAGKGMGPSEDDVDLRVYRKFEKGEYKDRSGRVIKEKTVEILKNALYTHSRIEWKDQYAFKLSTGEKIAYLQEYDRFVYVDEYDKLTPEDIKDFEKVLEVIYND